MILITLFMLAGVTLCQDAGDDADSREAHGNGVYCIEKAIKTVPVVFKKIAVLICKYDVTKTEMTNALYDDFLEELNTTFRYAGCKLDSFLGGHAFEGITTGAGTSSIDLLAKVLVVLFGILGISNTVPHTLCPLINSTLTSECLAKLLKGGAELTKNLNLQYLLLEAQKENMNYTNLINSLISLGCIAGDVLKAELPFEGVSELVDKVFGEEIRTAIKHILGKLGLT
ncbi:ranaspumin-like isoform X2 [Mixophyes fleayi]|uniref:ranaspumin-like isoform X2 n=1 Tax=Mixophyes fleayi TaxID=3061075 RepID=UPI003F4D845E